MGWFKTWSEKRKYEKQKKRVDDLREHVVMLRGAVAHYEKKATAAARELYKMEAALPLP